MILFTFLMLIYFTLSFKNKFKDDICYYNNDDKIKATVWDVVFLILSAGVFIHEVL